MNRRIAAVVLCLLALIAATAIAKSAILGGASVIRLGSAAPLAGAVSQGLATSGKNGSLPADGKDFSLSNVHYFDSRDWATVSVVSVQNKGNASIAILHKENGIYQVVLGPGTAFPSGYVQSLPQDVAFYLNTQGVVYEPGD